MLEPIFDLLRDVAEYWKPFEILDEYEKGVKLHFGKPVKIIESGKVNWRWPIIQKFITTEVVTTTHQLQSQTLITKDGKPFTVRGIIKCHISEVDTFLMEVSDQWSAVVDVTMGVMAKQIKTKEYDYVVSEQFDHDVTIKSRHECKKFGVYIETVTITDTVETQNFRVFINEAITIDEEDE